MDAEIASGPVITLTSPSCQIASGLKGTPVLTEIDEFSESLRGERGGVISDLTNFIAKLVLIQPELLVMNF